MCISAFMVVLAVIAVCSTPFSHDALKDTHKVKTTPAMILWLVIIMGNILLELR